MSIQERLSKIEYEISKGLKSKAIDRLRNLINENPNNIELRERLAETYYEAGFIDEAGKYWLLTEPIKEHIERCVKTYESSVNNSGTQILNDIKFRGDKNLLSQFAKNKMEQLESNSLKISKYIPKYHPKKNSGNSEVKYVETKKDKLTKYGLLLIGIIIVFLFFVGIVTVTMWFI